MSYPKNILRGIQNNQCITKDGLVSASAFTFHENPDRESEFLESSINWKDDDGAIDEILNKTKSNKQGELEKMFKYGYVELDKNDLDTIMRLSNCSTRLLYERYPIEDNDYHGNLLIVKGLSNASKRLISGTISSIVKSVTKREE